MSATTSYDFWKLEPTADGKGWVASYRYSCASGGTPVASVRAGLKWLHATARRLGAI